MKIPYKLHSHFVTTGSEYAQLQRFKAMVKNFVGNGARIRDLALHDGDRQPMILTAFFWLIQRPGKAAVWYNRPKSGLVRSGHHYMVRVRPFPILRLL